MPLLICCSQFTACTFSTVIASSIVRPFWQDSLGTSWCTSHNSQTSREVEAFSFRIPVGQIALLDRNRKVIFAQRVVGTRFEDSLMNISKILCFSAMLWQRVTDQQNSRSEVTGSNWRQAKGRLSLLRSRLGPNVSRTGLRSGCTWGKAKTGEGYTFHVVGFCWGLWISFIGQGRTRTLEAEKKFKLPLSLSYSLHSFTLSLPSSKSTFSQSFKEKCTREVARIGSIIVFHVSKPWKAKFSILRDVILLVRLQGKFDIDHSWEWKG